MASLSEAEYRDPILKALIDKLEAEGPEELRGHYIYGDTLAPKKSDLPVVSVSRDGTNIRSDGTMQDVHVSPIVVAIIVDWTTDLDQTFDLARGNNRLYRLVESRNPDFTLKTDSLAYVLRDNQKLADNLFISINDNGLQMDYGLGVEKRGSNIFSAEGILRFNIELTTKKPGLY
jgi:hypothetical protein